MTPEQLHAWQVINDALVQLREAEDDAQRVDAAVAEQAEVAARAAELAVLVTSARQAATGSARGRDTLRPLVEAQLAVELPPDLAASPQIAEVRRMLGLSVAVEP